MNRVAIVIALIAFPQALSAQWPDYPTPGVPKTAEGKPKLDGPAPRTADGHPDLSGIWENIRRNVAAGARPAEPPPPPDGPPEVTFRNIGAGFKQGLPLRPLAAEVLKRRMAENSKDNPDAHCLPMGLMQFHEHPQPRKIIQTPGVTVIVYEANSGLRQIFTDGRPLPRKEDVLPWWY